MNNEKLKTVIAKLHEGELIELLKMKSGYTYQQIANGISKTERSILKWKHFETLDKEIKEALAQFFSISVRAFDDRKVREEVLKSYKSTKVLSMVSEKQMPAMIVEVKDDVKKLREDFASMKEQFDRLLKQLSKRS